MNSLKFNQKMSEKPKARGIKRTVNNVIEKSHGQQIIWFNAQTLTQYKLSLGQYVQLSMDKSKRKVWAKIDLNPLLEKQDVQITRLIASAISASVDSCLLIYLSTVRSVFNVPFVSQVELKFNDDVKSFPMLYLVADSFKNWAFGEQRSFSINQQVNYEFCGKWFTFTITSKEVEKKDLFRLNLATKCALAPTQSDDQTSICNFDDWNERIPDVCRKVAGYPKQIQSFCEYIFNGGNYGFRGVLVRGESGVGKSYFVTNILETFSTAYSQKFSYENISSNLFRGSIGESEKYLRSRFMHAINTRKGIHVIVLEDLLDFESGARSEKLIISELVYCMNIAAKQQSLKIVLVAVVSNQDSLDSSLMRIGRLEKDIEINVPAPLARVSIFALLTCNKFSDDTSFTEEIMNASHGYVAADFVKLVSEASSIARQHGRNDYTQDDILSSIKTLKHSILLSSSIGDSDTKEKSTVRFSDLAGIDDIIQKIQISILYPLTNKEKYESLGIAPPRGVLLKGSPGTGKTTLARAIAHEAKANFISVQCPDIISKIVGAPSRAISHLFNRARAASPCVLFFDQFEAIARARGNDSSESQSSDQMLSTLLIEMDGVNTNSAAQVLVLAASNKPEMLDPAILRPGRFDQQIHLPIPDSRERSQIVKRKLQGVPVMLSEQEQVLFDSIVRDGLTNSTGADLENWCREAVMICLRENIQNTFVMWKHFEKAKQLAFSSIN